MGMGYFVSEVLMSYVYLAGATLCVVLATALLGWPLSRGRVRDALMGSVMGLFGAALICSLIWLCVLLFAKGAGLHVCCGLWEF